MRKLNTQDVFKLARLIKKANLKDDIKNLFEKSQRMEGDKDVRQKELGFETALVIIEKTADEGVENEFYSLLAGIAEKTSDDIKTLSIEAMIELFIQVAKENNVVTFFKVAYQSAKK